MARALPLLLAVGLALVLATLADASGKNLDGREAPSLVFYDGLNGLEGGGRLQDFRGQVVWVKFVLRDCALCRKSLPRFQELHERWGGSGLASLAVMHRIPAKDLKAFFAEHGYTFPVGIDSDGKQARRYGVGRRPTDYLIGADGRVRASNGAPEKTLRVELAKRRVARLGEIPQGAQAAKDLVWNWNYGEALRTIEPQAGAEGASDALRAFAKVLQREARIELDARLAAVSRLVKARRVKEARSMAQRVAKHFEETSLQARAKKAMERLEAR